MSGLTKELHENFESDTKDLTDDVEGQIDGFQNFDKQQKQIVDLEQRVKEGKTKADALTERLSKAKERVDARARSEVEWEVKHTRTPSTRNTGAQPTQLTVPSRARTHILGNLRLHSHPHPRLSSLPPAQAARRHARHESSPRLRRKIADPGGAHPRHCKGSHHWTFQQYGHREVNVHECCACFG